MTLLMALILAATALGGLLGGLSFDGALVKLPARRRIGTEGAYKIAGCFAEAVIEPVHFWDSGSIRSHFGVLQPAGIRVEVMGDLSKRNPDGSWDSPPNLALLTHWVKVADLWLPVLALEYEYEAYRKMGRLDKADLLRRWSDTHQQG